MMKKLLIGLLVACSVVKHSFAVEQDTKHNHERVVKNKVQYNQHARLLSDIWNVQSLFGDTIDPSFFDTVIENDTRREVVNVEKEPYNSIGLLVAKDPIRKLNIVGTAFKVSDKHLLTAAHNLVECEGGKRFFTDPIYYSGYNKGEASDRSEVARFFVPEDYCQGGCDIAIIELTKKIYPNSSLPLLALQEKELLNKSVRVIGYPNDLFEKSRSRYPIMFEDTGTITGIREPLLMHDANTHEGNSGGPVILDAEIEIAEDSEEYFPKPVVGVHVAGPNPKIDNNRNRATMINGSIFDIINKVLRNEKANGMEEVQNTKVGGSNETE